MVKGLETAASAMRANLIRMDVTSNNLANADTVGFKRDTVILKSFPEMLMRRVDSDGMTRFPLGSYDEAPIVGNMATGVEVNSIRTDFSNGLSLKRTGNDFDFGLEGQGFFVVSTDQGDRYTRDGRFTIDKDGYLVNRQGFKVVTDVGAVKVQHNNFRVDGFGTFQINSKYGPELGSMVDRSQNAFDQTKDIARLKIVNFEDPRELVKDGMGFFQQTRHSGKPQELPIDDGRSLVSQGYVESSNVNVVSEMVNMIKVQRSYEAAARVMRTHDELLGRLINEVGRAI